MKFKLGLVAAAAFALATMATANAQQTPKVYPPEHPPCHAGQDPGLCGPAISPPQVSQPVTPTYAPSLELLFIRESDNGKTITVSARNIVMVHLKESADRHWELTTNSGGVLDDSPVINHMPSPSPQPGATDDYIAAFGTQGVGTAELEFVCKDNRGNVVRTLHVTVVLPLTPDVAE